MPFLFTDKRAFLQLSSAVDERILFCLVAFAGGNGGGWARGEKAVTHEEFVLSLSPLLDVRPAFREVFIPRLNGGMAVCLVCGAFDDQIMIREHRSDCESKAQFSALDRLKAAIEALRTLPESTTPRADETQRDEKQRDENDH